MPGPINSLSRIVDLKTSEANAQILSLIIEYFDKHPGFVRIASNYGFWNTFSGSGLRGASSFVSQSKDNAWAVYRTLSSSVPYDLSFISNYNTGYIAGTWVGGNNYGIGVQMAYHPSGAWSGSVGNNGKDGFYTPSKPWRSGSIVFPRQNAEFGTDAINKNAVLKIFPSTMANFFQFFITGDNETTYIWSQDPFQYQVGDGQYFSCFGTYVPLTSSFDLPLFGFTTTQLQKNQQLGYVSQSDPTNGIATQGGMSYLKSSDFRSFSLKWQSFAPEKITKSALIKKDASVFASPISIIAFDPIAKDYQNVGIISGVFVLPIHTFGNVQDVSRSCVSVKMNMLADNLSSPILLPFSGSADFCLRGSF